MMTLMNCYISPNICLMSYIRKFPGIGIKFSGLYFLKSALPSIFKIKILTVYFHRKIVSELEKDQTSSLMKESKLKQEKWDPPG